MTTVRHALGLLVALAPLALPAAALAAPMVGDASFEAVSTGASGYAYNPTDAGGWTFTGTSGVASNGSAFGFASAPDGTKVAFVQSFLGGTGGAISQTISGLTVGTTYTVSFDLAARPGSGFGADPISLALGGSQIGTFTAASTSFQSVSTTFLASATSANLSFQGGTGAASQDLATAIDLVSVTASGAATAVPEPASMALLGAGVLGVLGLRRRRTGGGLAA